ncbi:hypothetical protein BH11PSE14_BH11PSE14_13590 [soil metagenome]
MKTRMKLLDYTLISLLGTVVPAAWAQTAPEPAPAPSDQTVVKIRSEGETGSVDTSPAGLQAFRRVDVTQMNPGTIPVSGRFVINLPSGGMIWATEDPQLAQPVLNVQAGSLVAFADGKIAGPVNFQTYSNYSAFAKSFEILVYRGSDTDLIDPVATIPGTVANFGQVTWDGAMSDGPALHEGDELQYVLRVTGNDGNVDETMPNRLQLVRPESLERSLNQLVRSGVGNFDGLSATQIQQRDLQSAINGTSNLRQQNIAVYGSRVRVVGQDIPTNMPISINGQPQPIDLERKFAAEFLLPVGQHSFDVQTGSGPQAAHRQLDINVTGKYFFMVGLADLTYSHNKISGSVAPVGLADRYDDTLTEGRLALYLKGKIKGKYLITAQADTTEREIGHLFKGFFDKDARDIFRRLDPDQYYPVYGDDSTTYRDADTQGKLYVRVDWDKNQALWGNFSTGLTHSEFSQYVRSLYGAAISWRSHGTNALGEPNVSVRAFGSEAQNAPGHSEFLGTGGSLYYLKHSDLLPGSEHVTLETRDEITGRVEVRTELIRGIDYEIDELQGRLIMTRPLMQIVRDNLPTITRDSPLDGFSNILLVDYEYVPQGFDTKQMTSGLSGKAWLGDHFAIGGTYVDENRSGEDYTLGSVDLTLQAGRGTYLKVEQAHTKSQSAPVFFSDNGGLSFVQTNGYAESNSGDARSLEARANFKELGWTDREWTVGAWWRKVDAGFSIARYSRGYDITEKGVEFAGQLTDDVRLSGRYSDADRGGESVQDGNLLIEWRIGENDRLVGELRHVTENRYYYYDSEDSYYGTAKGTLAAIKYSHRIGKTLDVYGVAQFTLDNDHGRYADNDAYTLGARYLFGNLSSFGAELTHGDRGNAATIDAEYQMSPMHTLYAGYTYSTDTTSGDPLFSTRTPSGLTLGQRWRVSNQVNLFNESQFLKQGNESGIAHTFGMDFYPRQGWSTGFTLQKGELSSYDGIVDRRAISVNAGHTSPATQWNSKLEYRRDSGDVDRTQWVGTNRILFKVNPDWRIAGRLNWSKTTDMNDPTLSAKFYEGNLGFAYRPVANDRLQVLGKYTYLYDLASFGQDSLSEYDQRSNILSLEGIWRLNTKFEMAGKVAYRKGEARLARGEGEWFNSTADFYAIQARYDLAWKWDALLEHRWLKVNQNDSSRSGWLVGVDRHVSENFRVGLGYNFTSFSDDLAVLDYDHKGWFLNVTGTY